MGHVGAAKIDEILFGCRPAGLEADKGTRGFSPFLIRPCNDSRFHHRRVAIEHALDLDGGNVFAAGNDDVLGAILDLDVTVGMAYGQIARMKPATIEGLGRGIRVLQISAHHVIAAKEDLAHRLAIVRHGFHGIGIAYHQSVQHRVTHALARLQPGLFGNLPAIPFVVPGAHHGRTIGLGETVGMGNLEAHPLHRLDHGSRRCSPRRHHIDPMIDTLFQIIRRMSQHVEHDGGSAEMGYLLGFDEIVDPFHMHTAHADRCSGDSGQCPGKAPAIAMKHRQRPQIDRVVAHAPGEDVAHRIQIGAAMVVDDALGIAGRA